MYDFNITAAEMAAYAADMLEMDRSNYMPTEEEMEEMASYYGED